MVFSVVIAAFNEEDFLPKTLQSLKNQTYKGPVEIIVVDNNSTDNTASIAAKYGARVIKETTQGYAFACNKGFYSAKGDIIARADADYVLPDTWLEKIANQFAKDHSIIALGGPAYPLESTWLENIFYYPGLLLWLYGLKILGRGFLIPNMAVKKEAFYKIGGFNTTIQFGEDNEICMRLKKIGKVAFCPHIYVYASTRRLRALGLFDFIVKYGFGNQIKMSQGKKITVGLNPVRLQPVPLANTSNPMIYLISGFTFYCLMVVLMLYCVIALFHHL